MADKELEHCVAQVGEPQIAALMLAGVRVGGSPYFPTTFRWGYGWPFPRLYKPLTEDEQLKINFQMQAMQETAIPTYCQVATENTSLTTAEQTQLENYVLNNEFISGCVTEKLADLAEKSSSKPHLCEQAKAISLNNSLVIHNGFQFIMLVESISFISTIPSISLSSNTQKVTLLSLRRYTVAL